MIKAFVPLLLLVACKCPPQATTTTAPTPGPSSPAAPAPGPGTGSAPGPAGSANEPTPTWQQPAPAIGDNCGANDACAQGLTCVAYYGIAGPRGPQFKTCEIRCTADTGCPADHKCVTIADGPGQVCRK